MDIAQFVFPFNNEVNVGLACEQGCRDISRYAIYRDIFLVISRYKRTWIYGDSRNNRRRKTEIYEKVIQQMQLVLGHACMHIHSNSAAVLRTYIL